MLQELLQALARWIGDQRLWVTVFSDTALINKDQAGSHFLSKADFVGHDDHCHPFFSQILHDFQHFVTQFRVKRRGWLIEQHHLRFYRQCAGDSHTLLLSTGQLRWVVMSTLREADFSQQIFSQRFRRRFAGATYAQWTKHYVFQRRQVREQVELLEHHAGFLANQTVVDFRVIHLQAIDNQIAAGDLFQLVDAAQQGRFTGTGWPDNDHHFTLFDVQIDIVQHLGWAKVLGNVFKFNHRIFILLSRRRRTKLRTRVMIR
ncbi:hypothetical protein EcWSU1_01356 [Enterobacter ludwigii]|uniref:Uncharacterized protein n=1 Tax=Enterobacter ludwigii TaxID=299767 RepID=G8LFY7_9ENTR|nr:hypothetical protein EcWSU1_01356 [Enterobacter ludwigii]